MARIKTLGLLGDKFVELTSGSPELPMIPSGAQIPSAQPTNVDALLASGEDVMDNVVEISASLSTILGRMERGEGLLGELTSDSPSGRRLRESMVGTFESVERIAEKIDSGHGPAAAPAQRPPAWPTGWRPRWTASRASWHGPRPAPACCRACSTTRRRRQQFDDTLATVNQVARDLQGFTADLQTSEALLPRLVNDEDYGREVTGQVQQIVERLNLVAERLTDGRGHGGEADQRPADLRGGQRHPHRGQRVVAAALADPQPAEGGHRETLRGPQAGARGCRASRCRRRSTANRTSTPEELGAPPPEPPPTDEAVEPDEANEPPPPSGR